MICKIEICNLQNGNMLVICKIEICNLQFLFCKSSVYFHFCKLQIFISFRFISIHFANYTKPFKIPQGKKV